MERTERERERKRKGEREAKKRERLWMLQVWFVEGPCSFIWIPCALLKIH